MPSDARTTEALRSLQGARQAFLSAVATASDAARSLLAAHDGATGDSATRAARAVPSPDTPACAARMVRAESAAVATAERKA